MFVLEQMLFFKNAPGEGPPTEGPAVFRDQIPTWDMFLLVIVPVGFYPDLVLGGGCDSREFPSEAPGRRRVWASVLCAASVALLFIGVGLMVTTVF